VAFVSHLVLLSTRSKGPRFRVDRCARVTLGNSDGEPEEVAEPTHVLPGERFVEDAGGSI
jgi:hypothetical protein